MCLSSSSKAFVKQAVCVGMLSIYHVLRVFGFFYRDAWK